MGRSMHPSSIKYSHGKIIGYHWLWNQINGLIATVGQYNESVNQIIYPRWCIYYSNFYFVLNICLYLLRHAKSVARNNKILNVTMAQSENVRSTPEELSNWWHSVAYGCIYPQTCNMSCTLIGNKIVDHSDVVGTSPVGASPTTSSFST